MNCCKNKNDNGSSKEKSFKGFLSHMFMMVLCCGTPVIIILLLPAIGAVFPGAKNIISSVVPYLCPILMVPMIIMMARKHKRDGEGNSHCETKRLESNDLK